MITKMVFCIKCQFIAVCSGSAVAQLLSGRVLDLRPRGRGFKPYRRDCVVSLGKTHLS